VLNSSLAIAQFWDGRAADLKEQRAGPIANPGEMAASHTLAIGVLESIPEYVTEFKLVFGEDGIDIDKVTQAIADFETTLVTPNSRFDQWLPGDGDALTARELEGHTLLKDSGCVACHNGEAAGGTSFQKMGVIEPYQTKSEVVGLAAVTGKDTDRFKFKVHTLRDVGLTYPCFHDGEAETLTEAVDIMGRLQLGKKLTPEENAKIVDFLKSPVGK
jgi:cytochrome c peroxidase